MTDLEIKFYEDGFIILKNVFDVELVSEARSLQSRIASYADRGLVDPFQKWSIKHRNDQGVLYDLYQRHPIFQGFVKNSRVVDALKVFLGEDIYLYDNSLIYKPKGSENAVPWHQDFISRPEEPLKIVAWMPLDDVNRNNGTLKVIPGSHKSGHLGWHRVKGETHHDRVNLDHVDEESAVYVDMKAGDVLLFNMLLIHGSDKVDGEAPRRVFRCSYQSMKNAVFTPRQSPIVISGGDPEFLEEAYPTKASEQKEGVIKKIGHKIGRRLLAL